MARFSKNLFFPLSAAKQNLRFAHGVISTLGRAGNSVPISVALAVSLFILGWSGCAAAQSQYTIWPSSATPSIIDVGPDWAVELGVSFKADTNGYVTGIRFYKSSANTGPHVGNLWTNTGTLLASATFTGETASGWQQATFPKPVAITANTVYVASYHVPNGHWSVSWYYFASAGVNSALLHALANATGTPDGRFAYGGTSAFPTSSHQSANYWVDVAYTSTASAGLQVTTAQLPGGTVSSAYGATLSATGGSAPYTWSLLSGALPAGLSLSTAGTVSGTPTLAGSFPFTVQVKDAAGQSASASLAIAVNSNTLGAGCTLYASPSGSASNSGRSASAPKTFSGAAAAAQPGSVICLLGGSYNLSSTFYPPTSGTSSSWIVYKNYGDGPVNFVWTGGAITQPMFKFGNGTFPSGAAYLEFRGFNLDGQNDALDGFFCQGGHHLRFINNSINNTGGSGVGAVHCDYLTSDHNLIDHNGYLYGWTSAISYNNVPWFDSYTGFHNIASNNIITGEYDGSSNHTDGNGIILDLGSNTPPALIINNVVYGNGGRCIQANGVTSFWIINNTCYKSDLDTSLGNVGSFTSQNSNNGYFINNVTQAWQSSNPSYDQEGANTNIHYYADMYYGAPNNFNNSDPSQLINANPLFLSPPSLTVGGYVTSLAPSLLGTGLTLQSNSPAYNKGIDPSTLSGLPSAIVTDLKKYIYTDINGRPRPQGGGSDLGAYQH
jgi:Domain of unknown function (DUF4082)/Putative Ig domain